MEKTSSDERRMSELIKKTQALELSDKDKISKDKVLIDSINRAYRRIWLASRTGIEKESDYKLITVQPVACAVRMLNGYDLDELTLETRLVSILAAASLAYYAYGLDEDFGIYPGVEYWLNLLNISDKNKRDFVKIQWFMLKNENFDVCRNEKSPLPELEPINI